LEQKDKSHRYVNNTQQDQTDPKKQKHITMENVSRSRHGDRQDQLIAGCAAGAAKPAETQSGRNAPPAFLRHRYTPAFVPDDDRLYDQRRVQREYFRSARHLADLYTLQVPDVQSIPYPLNIYQSYLGLEKQLAEKTTDLSLAIVQGADGWISLATAEPAGMRYTLYYFPIHPAYRLMRKPGTKAINPIIMEMLRYLFHRFNLPYYRDEGTYLHDTYLSIDDYLIRTGDRFEEPADDRRYAIERKKLERIGDFMRKSLSKPFDVSRLSRTLSALQPTTISEDRLAALGRSVLRLEEVYPDRCLFDDIPSRLFDPNIEERITKYHYLSFCYDLSDWWWDLMQGFIDPEIQECGAVDYPAAYQVFREPQRSQYHDSTYTDTAFGLIEDFLDIINNLCHDKHYRKV
jgi:hypothetical protein